MLTWILLFATAAQLPATAPAPAPEAPVSAEALDLAIQRGARWLRGQQAKDGSFEPVTGAGVSPLAVSAMALWSLNEPEPRCLDAPDAERAARFLVAHARGDGGIYDPDRGLAVYTSGVAARALRTLAPGPERPEFAAALAAAELFHYRHAAPESVVDAVKAGELPLAKSAEAAGNLLRGLPPGDEARRKALEFLARQREPGLRAPSRLRAPVRADAPNAPGDPNLPRATGGRGDLSRLGAFSYDDLLPFVYADLAPDHQLALRARAALVQYYTPDCNPDLTRRYGEQGFRAGSQGLYYYYLVATRALSTFSEPVLVTADGASHVWAAEIGARLVGRQRPDGSWANADAIWWESEPVLATSYALLSLKLCRASLSRAAKAR